MGLSYDHTRGYGRRVTHNDLVRRHGSLGRIKSDVKSWHLCTKDDTYNSFNIPDYNIAGDTMMTQEEVKWCLKQL